MNSTALPCSRMGIETHRHRGEVRMLIASSAEPSRGQAWVDAYLAHPRVSGRAPALASDMRDQLNKGHDGQEGLWL